MSRTPNDFLRARVGNLLFEISTLESENAGLRERIGEIGRMLPPEKLAELQAKVAGVNDAQGLSKGDLAAKPLKPLEAVAG